MIGQAKLYEKINKLKVLPRFTILEGPSGCGKSVLAHELSDRFSLNYINTCSKIGDIEEMIEVANKTKNNLFVIENGDNLNPTSENALLKITEELPNDNYIILCCSNSSKLLPTIISRGELFKFSDYTEDDFEEYIKENPQFEDKELSGKYSLLYPNFKYLLFTSRKDIVKLYKICDDLTNFDLPKNDKILFVSMAKLSDIDLEQVLFALEHIALAKMLTGVNTNSKIITYKLLKFIEAVMETNKLLSESANYNRNYIIDKLCLRFIEVNDLCK